MDQPAEIKKRGHSPLVGIVIIIIGVIFLLENLYIIDIGYHWWALFFLIPISFLASDIWCMRKNNQGKIPASARGKFIGMAVLLFIMFVFLLGLDWGMIWPVFIIIGGLSIILSSSRK
jgi:hypothetical protein